MLRAEENEILTRVGPGTLMGELLRRYWTPACLTAEIPEPGGAPARVRLLSENLVAFRDTAGRIGDDYIQTQIEHQTFNASTETHGTSAQRQKWFTTGYRAGEPKACDTFSAATL